MPDISHEVVTRHRKPFLTSDPRSIDTVDGARALATLSDDEIGSERQKSEELLSLTEEEGMCLDVDNVVAPSLPAIIMILR